jgi:hypothetical protein
MMDEQKESAELAEGPKPSFRRRATDVLVDPERC